jgi:hypothetical protein
MEFVAALTDIPKRDGCYVVAEVGLVFVHDGVVSTLPCGERKEDEEVEYEYVQHYRH